MQGASILNRQVQRVCAAAICTVNSAKGDAVNRDYLYLDAALRRDRFLAERVLVERRRHRLRASMSAPSAPTIWTPLFSSVCERSYNDPRGSGVT